MKENELYSWIAWYTVENDKYMRLASLGSAYDYYNTFQSDEQTLRSNFGISKDEVVLSFLQSIGLFDGYKGVVFTDYKVYYKDNLGSIYSYEYSANSNFYSGALAFDADKIIIIMNDIYEKIYEYAIEVAKSKKRNKMLATGVGVAAALATLGVTSEVSTQKSDALESGGILDILNELSDLFK